MTASMLVQMILGILLIAAGTFGKNFRVGPGTLWSYTPPENEIPVSRWAGATLFVVFGLGFIYYALRPLIWH